MRCAYSKAEQLLFFFIIFYSLCHSLTFILQNKKEKIIYEITRDENKNISVSLSGMLYIE